MSADPHDLHKPEPPQRIRLWWDSASGQWRLSYQANSTSDKPEYVLASSVEGAIK